MKLDIPNREEISEVLRRHDAELRDAQQHLRTTYDALISSAQRTSPEYEDALLRAQEAAIQTAFSVADEEALPLEVRALASLTYGHGQLLHRNDEEAHLDATMARVAVLSQAFSCAGTGEPLLFIDGGYDMDPADFVAATLSVDSLTINLPTRPAARVQRPKLLDNGFVGLRLDGASIAIENNDQGVSMKPPRDTMMYIAGRGNGHYTVDPLEYGLLRGRLISGETALRAESRTMRPMERRVASTVLASIGVHDIIETDE